MSHFVLEIWNLKTILHSTVTMTDNNFLVPQTKPESMQAKKLPCPFSPAGMLQPSHLQPPPMFGPRGKFCFPFPLLFVSTILFVLKGTTIPPKHLAPYAHFKINRSQPRHPVQNKNFTNQQYRSKDSVPRYRTNNQDTNSHRAHQHYQKSREFWCEPCDRDFRSEDLLQEHKSQHQRCGIDGCKFVGHEIIVNKHIQMQHSTGLYERLKNLETPEDISKWREERKKRYPTKANIELRQQMQEERNKRGEKLNNSKARFGRSSDRKRCNNGPTDGSHATDKSKDRKPNQNKEGKKKRRRPNKKAVVPVEQQQDEIERNEIADNNGLPMFCGTSQLPNYKKRKEMQPKNALSSLLGVYQSDSDSNDECSDDTESSEETTILQSSEVNSFEETSSTKADESIVSDQTSDLEENLNDSPSDEPIEERMKSDSVSIRPESSVEKVPLDIDMEELPSEEPITKTERIDDFTSSIETGKVNQRRKTKSKVLDKRLSKRPTIMDLSKKYRNQNTMLEKLLQNEIRHERNVLLQCVRHVVKENFFGIGQKPS